MRKNEFGEVLDRNGYAPSIAPPVTGCRICCRTDRPLQRHEVFHGANRQKSKAYGCWIEVCPQCHEAIHRKSGALDRGLKAWMQGLCRKRYGWDVEEFRARFGKNYLEVE